MPDSSNPEQNPNRQAHIPDEWKSLIQDGIYDLNGQRTKEYLDSEYGKRELAAEAQFAKNTDAAKRMIFETNRAETAGEITSEQADKRRARYEDYLSRKDFNKLDRSGFRQDFVGSQSVGTPEEQARYQAWLENKDAENMSNIQETGREVIGDRVVLAERGEKTIDATEPQTADGEDTSAPETSPTGEDAALAAELKKWDELQSRGAIGKEDADRIKQAIITAYANKQAGNTNSDPVIDNHDAIPGDNKPIDAAEDDKDDQWFDDFFQQLDRDNNPDIDADKAADIDTDKDADIDADKAAEIEKAKAAELAKDKADALAASRRERGLDEPELRWVGRIGEFSKEISKKKGFRIAVGAMITAAIIVATTSIFGGGGNISVNSMGNTQTRTETQAEYSVDADNAYGETNEVSNDRNSGYSKLGLYDSEYKAKPVDFAYAAEVTEAVGENPHDHVEYVADNMSEAFAGYYAFSSIDGETENVETLSELVKNTENSLEKQTDEEYGNTLEQWKQWLNESEAEPIELNGNYASLGIIKQNPDGGYDYENMYLDVGENYENGTQAIKFTHRNPNTGEIDGTLIVKINGCEQPVVKVVTPENYATYTEAAQPETQPKTPETPPETQPETQPKTPETPPETPPETIAPKDEENLERIDENINNDIAEDIGTDEINITPTEEVSAEDITEQPSAADYQGTEPTIIQNEASAPAEQIQEQVSPENNYSQDLGGANANEYAPVQENEAAQAAADAAEIPIEQAPTEGEALENALNDLGIY